MEATKAPWARAGNASAAAIAAPGTEATMAPWAAAAGGAAAAAAMPPPPPRVPGGGGGSGVEREFMPPVKVVRTPQDVSRFAASATYAKLLALVNSMQQAATGRRVLADDDCSVSPAVTAAVQLVGSLADWIEQIPPMEQAMRYGNKAFRQWHQRLVADSPALLAAMLPTALAPAVVELQGYLAGSFGDPMRIDYGTGHETCFVAWLLCLFELGFFQPVDRPALVLKLFPCYLQLMRRLQLTYRLEPAGTHGVWGLDDYHILPCTERPVVMPHILIAV